MRVLYDGYLYEILLLCILEVNMKAIIWILCVVYCILPTDIATGPLDDIILIIAAFDLTHYYEIGSSIKIENK